MKHKYLIVGHSLLGYNDLLTPVDNKVASLIELAVLSTADTIVLIHLVKLAELRTKHHRYLANHDPSRVKLAEYLLDFPLALASLGIGVVCVSLKLFFRQCDIDE